MTVNLYRWGMVSLALLVAAITGANKFWNFHGGESASERERPAAAEGRLDDNAVVCFGHVDVEHGVRGLYPLQPGRVAKVLVNEGDLVDAGASLLTLDDRNARLILQETGADLNSARAQLMQAEKSREQHASRVKQQKSSIEAWERRLSAARHGMERKKELAKIQQVGSEELAAAEDQSREVEAGLAVEREKLNELELIDPEVPLLRARAEVSARDARLAQAQRALDEHTLRAPQKGEILRVLAGPGEVLGTQPREPAILFIPLTRRFIRAEVTQEFADRVRSGLPALIHDDIRAQQTWKGKVSRVSDWYTQRRSVMREPSQFNDVRTLECIVQVDEGQEPLRIGQRVRVVIGREIP